MALFLFGVLVFVHELGHYIAARLCRVRVLEFAIGMGPKLLKWTSKKTGIVYSLRLLPVGGFCSMEGEGDYDNMNPPIKKSDSVENEAIGEPDEKREEFTESVEAETPETADKDVKADSRSFKNKPAWIKLIILFAGPLMNILLGFILTFVLVVANRSNGMAELGSTKISVFDQNAISFQTGLMVDDTIIKVGNVSVHTAQELSYEIGIQGKNVEYYDQISGDSIVQRPVISLDLTVIRDGREMVIKDVKFLAVTEQGTTIGVADFKVYREQDSFGNIIKQTFFRSVSSVKMVWDSLIGMITGRFGLESVSGPVGTTQVIVQAAQTGWYTLIFLITVISMNLGVFNLLPFLPLDGGHIVFSFYELIFRKPVPKKVAEYCQIAGVLVMMGLMIIIAVKDVVNLF